MLWRPQELTQPFVLRPSAGPSASQERGCGAAGAWERPCLGDPTRTCSASCHSEERTAAAGQVLVEGPALPLTLAWNTVLQISAVGIMVHFTVKKTEAWEKAVSSASVLAKLDSCMYISDIRRLPHTTHKSKLTMAQDLSVRHGIIKLLEENMGKTLSDLSLSNVFLGQSPKAIETKAKQMGPTQTYNLFTVWDSREALIQQRKLKTNWKDKIYGMGENVANDAIDRGLISKIYTQLVQVSSCRWATEKYTTQSTNGQKT